MKRFLVSVYGGMNYLSYLLLSGHGAWKKCKLLAFWLKINLKNLILAPFFSMRYEHFLGYVVEAFDYATIRYLFEEIFFKNEYFFSYDGDAPVIIDCGANIGFAVLFFKWVYPDSTVYAFEPDKATFELLQRNVKRNGLSNVHLYNAAVADVDGTIDFFVDSDEPGSLVMSTNKERMSKHKVVVDAVSLPRFFRENNIRSVDYFKMDIEGSEADVVQNLVEHGLLEVSQKYCIEYHHKIGSAKSQLSKFLAHFEGAGFEYQIDAQCQPVNSEGKFQDILLYVYR